MNGWWDAVLAVASGLAMAVVGNMVSDEVCGRPELLPRALIKLGCRRLPRHLRADAEDEWLAELRAIVEETGPLPVTRFLTATRFALGIVRAAPAVGREITGSQRSRRRVDWQIAAIWLACGIGSVAAWRIGGGMTAGVFVPALAGVVLSAARRALRARDAEHEFGAAVTAMLCQAMETRDRYTLGHGQRVSRGSAMLAAELGLGPARVKAIGQAGLLHDVGKLGVPAHVLRKAGALTEEEYGAIQLHTYRSLEIGQGLCLSDEALTGIFHHHERFDGRGYPMGFAGKEVPLAARIVAVVDAFDSMTTTRCYRKARRVVDAMVQLRQGAGTQFDPEVVEAFARVLERRGWLPARAGSTGAGGQE